MLYPVAYRFLSGTREEFRIPLSRPDLLGFKQKVLTPEKESHPD